MPIIHVDNSSAGGALKMVLVLPIMRRKHRRNLDFFCIFYLLFPILKSHICLQRIGTNGTGDVSQTQSCVEKHNHPHRRNLNSFFW